jgi:hypothetical protein
MHGQALYTDIFTENEISIPVGGILEKGLYFARVRSSEKILTRKFFIL